MTNGTRFEWHALRVAVLRNNMNFFERDLDANYDVAKTIEKYMLMYIVNVYLRY